MIKVTHRGKEKFKWYLSLSPINQLHTIPEDRKGYDALSCFCHKESTGEILPCCESQILANVLWGKKVHGISISNIAKDFAIDRLIFSKEIKENYPKWVANEVFNQAKKISLEQLGFIPTFVANQRDFSEICL